MEDLKPQRLFKTPIKKKKKKNKAPRLSDTDTSTLQNGNNEHNEHSQKPHHSHERSSSKHDKKRKQGSSHTQEKSKRKKHDHQKGNKPRDSRSSATDNRSHSSQEASLALNTTRRLVDAETMQYFLEISSLLGSGSSVSDSEERSALIANALEETYGKELELCCDKTCSRVLETLVHSSDGAQIASFLHRISPNFASISMDPAGSHVAEALLKSASLLLRDFNEEAAWFKTFNQALSSICQTTGENAVDMMCNCYSSHVVRGLLSLLSGMAFEDSDKQSKGHSGGLLGRLSQMHKPANVLKRGDILFPQLLHSLIQRLVQASKKNPVILCTDGFASPILQAVLKILVEDHEEVSETIKNLLGCNNAGSGALDAATSETLKQLIFDSIGSHLVEAMLEVAPDSLYEQICEQIFSHNILEYALHPSANFVIQALIASLRSPKQLDLLLTDLKPNFWMLIREMRSGIIVSILNACKKFKSNEQEVCRSLAKAINSETSSVSPLVPRLLFLENYARSNGSKDWSPDFQKRMSVLGCAMLQTIFSLPEECNQQFWLSLVSMESDDLVTTIKDRGGSHVVESFLLSSAPWKQKNRLISKLKGHFAELAQNMLGSFTVEKCFSAGKIELKESIALELAKVHGELEKTKHGPYLIRKFDLNGYAKSSEQWRKRMIAKQGTLKAFSDIFKQEITS